MGDNIFYGEALKQSLSNKFSGGACILCYKVNDPERYGVAKISGNKVVEIVEKPNEFVSEFAVTGIYVYDNSVITKSKSLSPSVRGELEITDLNNLYIEEGNLQGLFLDSEMIWMDTGTFNSLHDASSLVKALQNRTGHLIGSPELISYKNNWVKKDELAKTLNDEIAYDIAVLDSLD